MCLAIPGKVINIKGHKATIKYLDEEKSALVGDEKLKKGDYVMVQMGIVVKILTESEAQKSLKAWNVT